MCITLMTHMNGPHPGDFADLVTPVERRKVWLTAFAAAEER